MFPSDAPKGLPQGRQLSHRGVRSFFQRSIYRKRQVCCCRTRKAFSEISDREPSEKIMFDCSTRLIYNCRENERRNTIALPLCDAVLYIFVSPPTRSKTVHVKDNTRRGSPSRASSFMIYFLLNCCKHVRQPVGSTDWAVDDPNFISCVSRLLFIFHLYWQYGVFGYLHLIRNTLFARLEVDKKMRAPRKRRFRGRVIFGCRQARPESLG